MASTSSATKVDAAILIRPATFSDVPTMANVAFLGYAGSPLEAFLSPLRPSYPEDARHGWAQRMILRWFNPRMVSYVAHPASDPDKIVGYTQFSRLGDDDGAKRQIASRMSFLFWVQGLYYSIKFKISNYFWPDRSADLDAVRRFEKWWKIDDALYWNAHPDRQNRWHTQSIVVDSEWRGKGVGSKLMSEVIRRAGKENVVVGLEASEDGEYLYRKVGFELLGRFYNDGKIIGNPDTGGIMIWRPKKVKST